MALTAISGFELFTRRAKIRRMEKKTLQSEILQNPSPPYLIALLNLSAKPSPTINPEIKILQLCKGKMSLNVEYFYRLIEKSPVSFHIQ